jgi:molecular chaperone HtpG
MPEDLKKETFGFQAEVKQLLDLMIHSLYSNKDIFLRELISNASDAIDRLRFSLLREPSLAEDDPDFAIRVSYEKEAQTITIADNGIGMTRAEVVEHIGTIAKSGTREFLHSLQAHQQQEINVIGQFGVGFYSAFVVADRVTLTTRHAGLSPDQGVRWESDGQGEYQLETIERATKGTSVTLHLRAGEEDLLDGARLRSIIRQYSDHIPIPILMKSEQPGKDEEETVNRASALWTRPKSEISEHDYHEFYKYLSHDFEDPLTFLHSRMEGVREYILLLYIPRRAPFDLWSRQERQGIKLYVRRVFILDIAEQFLPRYLRFVRGLVDSSDLPLNVSRELLQHNRLLETMRATAVKRILSLLADLAENHQEQYRTFWKAFGRVLKEGMIEDAANRETLAPLLRLNTTKSATEDEVFSLAEYLERRKAGQEKMYYLTAESFGAARESPLLEIFAQKGIEVLLLTEPVDQFWVTELTEFRGVALQSLSRGMIDLSQVEDEQERAALPESEAWMEGLLKRLKGALGEEVKDVRASTRLTTSPACLVVDESGIDPHLERLLNASGHLLPTTKPILEINAQHPLIQRLKQVEGDATFQEWAQLLFEQSQLSLTGQLEHPIRFVNRLNALLLQAAQESRDAG